MIPIANQVSRSKVKVDCFSNTFRMLVYFSGYLCKNAMLRIKGKHLTLLYIKNVKDEG